MDAISFALQGDPNDSASWTCFTDDPLASDSAQFALARPMGTPENTDSPSSDAVRPWGLRGMKTLSGTGQQITTWRYDHERQVAVDGDGTPLNDTRMSQPTANKVTSNDGDEGPSEDFTYDFAPDAPFSPT
ncbi:MAG: putative ATP-grasp-modified RiPP [Pseudonocardiaceae bacterium]